MKKNKVVVGLLSILLGPIGGLIATIYMGDRVATWVLIGFYLFTIGILTIFPLLVPGTWLVMIVFGSVGYVIFGYPPHIILGLFYIFRDQDKFDFDIHKTRDHAGINKNKGECLTRECDNTFDSWKAMRFVPGLSVPSQGYGQAGAAQNPAGQMKTCPYCAETIHIRGPQMPLLQDRPS